MPDVRANRPGEFSTNALEQALAELKLDQTTRDNLVATLIRIEPKQVTVEMLDRVLDHLCVQLAVAFRVNRVCLYRKIPNGFGPGKDSLGMEERVTASG